MEAAARGQAHGRGDVGAHALLRLPDVQVGGVLRVGGRRAVADQMRGREHVAARLEHHRALRVERAHVQPHAASLGIAGRQLVSGLVADPHRQRAAGDRAGDRRRLLQVVGCPLDARLQRGRVDLGAEGGMEGQHRRDERVGAGEAVEGQIGAQHAEVRVTARHLRHVTVLAGGDDGLVAAELRRVHAALGVRARGPLVERGLLREALGGIRRRRVHRRQLPRPRHGVLREQRVAQVVAGAADLAARVERRHQRRSLRSVRIGAEVGDDVERSAQAIERIDHHHGGAGRRHGAETGEDRGVLGRVAGMGDRSTRRWHSRTARPDGRRPSSRCRPRAWTGPRAIPSGDGSGDRSHPSGARAGSTPRAPPT